MNVLLELQSANFEHLEMKTPKSLQALNVNLTALIKVTPVEIVTAKVILT